MNIVCIGAGRLAHHLMPVLRDADCTIIQVYDRNAEKALLLTRKLESGSAISDLSELDVHADLYLLMVSDDAIPEVAAQIENLYSIQGIGVHCSGTLPVNVLSFYKRGVFYPLQTFSENHNVDWSKVPIIITSDNDEVVSTLTKLASKITSGVYEMNDQQKSGLHLAAVFANNFTNHMLTIAEKICTENNVPFEILRPLIETTIQKAMDKGPLVSQTGPAVRGDESTIEKHEGMLSDYPEIIAVYKAVTRSIKEKRDPREL